MVLRLAVLKACIESTSIRVDHQYGAFGLRGSRDHVGHVVSMARAVYDTKVLVLGAEVRHGSVNCNASSPFLLVCIHNESKVEGVLVVLIGRLCGFMQLSLVQLSHQVQQVSCEGALTRIYVSYDDHVEGSLLVLQVEVFDILNIR